MADDMKGKLEDEVKARTEMWRAIAALFKAAAAALEVITEQAKQGK